MNDLTNDRLGTLVVEALERTAFVLAETVEAEEAATFKPTRHAIVSFKGAANGAVLLSGDDGFVSELASSILGVEPEDVDPTNEGKDALNELANIVGGSVILEFGGADQDYQYGLPTSLAQRDVPDDPPDAVRCFVEAECGILSVAWLPNVAGAKAAA